MGTAGNETLLIFKSMPATEMLKKSLNSLSGNVRKFVKKNATNIVKLRATERICIGTILQKSRNVKSVTFLRRINMKCHHKYI
jgi:hypothetical protein